MFEKCLNSSGIDRRSPSAHSRHSRWNHRISVSCESLSVITGRVLRRATFQPKVRLFRMSTNGGLGVRFYEAPFDPATPFIPGLRLPFAFTQSILSRTRRPAVTMVPYQVKKKAKKYPCRCMPCRRVHERKADGCPGHHRLAFFSWIFFSFFSFFFKRLRHVGRFAGTKPRAPKESQCVNTRAESER